MFKQTTLGILMGQANALIKKPCHQFRISLSICCSKTVLQRAEISSLQSKNCSHDSCKCAVCRLLCYRRRRRTTVLNLDTREYLCLLQ